MSVLPFPSRDPDDDVVVIDRVPLDDVTYARLQEAADGLALSVQAVISGIVHDVMNADINDDDVPDVIRFDANKDLN